MKLYKHDSYEQYLKAQVRKNRRKRNRHWVSNQELTFMANVIRERCDGLSFGICHGVRTGLENKALSELLGVEVVGTDLVCRDGVMEMDFHDRMAEWEGSADFVYSNSLDHSHNPYLALCAWRDSLRPGGLLLIHFGREHKHGTPDAADCFLASKEEYREMLSEFGSVEEIKMFGRTLFVVRVP